MKLYYPADPETREYTGTPGTAEVCQLTGDSILPGNASWTLPVYGENECAVLRSDGTWEIVPDYRGVWYDKTTGAETRITELRVMPGNNLTRKAPTGPFDRFDEAAGDWIFDLARYRSARIDEVSATSFARRAELFPDYRRDNLIAGIVYDEPYTLGNYRATVEAFRAEYYRLKAAIEAAATRAAVDSVVAGAQWPDEIIEA